MTEDYDALDELELEDEQAEELPDREAMSIVHLDDIGIVPPPLAE